MNVCSMPGCQTTAGCICDRTARAARPSLSAFTDEEIAREYHGRAIRKLGDPRIGVSVPVRGDMTPWDY